MEDIKEEKKIPGTYLLFKKCDDKDDGSELERDGDIILYPQPSASPNDPLRMPRWKKYIQLSIILWYKGFIGAMSNVLSVQSNGFLVEHPTWNYNDVNIATAITFVGIGWAGAALNGPIPHIWGVRLEYLLCTCYGIVGSAWMANINSRGDIIGSQLFIGMSTSAAEGLSQLSISQIFYQHELADFIAFYIVSLAAGTYLGPLVGGYIVQYPGWKWIGWHGLIFSCVTLLLIFFLLEETSFDRVVYNQQHRKLSASEEECINDSEENTSEKQEGTTKVEPRKASFYDMELRKSYWKRIAILTPAATIKGYGFRQYFERLVLQCRVFLFPATWFAGLHWGWGIGWLSFYLTTEEEVWILPPWNYGSTALGIMMVPVFIGAVLGCLYSLYATDWFVKYVAKRNHGILESESRLWCMMPSIIFGPLGLLLFGAGTEYRWSWPVPYVGLAFIGANFGITSDISMTYLVDCYPAMSLESVNGISMIYTVIALILCFVVEPWFNIGQMNTYISCAVVQFFLCCLIVPMIYTGNFWRRKTMGLYYRFIELRDTMHGKCTKITE